MDKEGIDLSPLLKISDTDLLVKFIFSCIDDLIKKTPVLDDHIHTEEVELTKEDYRNALQAVQHLYIKATHEEDFDFDQITDLDKNIIEVLKSCYEIRKNAISKALLVLKLSENKLLMKDFDWRLKVILGSSSYSSLYDPIVEFDFLCVKKNGSETNFEKVPFEMDCDELDKLISVLESANTNNNTNDSPI